MAPNNRPTLGGTESGPVTDIRDRLSQDGWERELALSAAGALAAALVVSVVLGGR